MTEHLWANKYQRLLCLSQCLPLLWSTPLHLPSRRLAPVALCVACANSPRLQQQSCTELLWSLHLHLLIRGTVVVATVQLFCGIIDLSVLQESIAFKLLGCQGYLRIAAPAAAAKLGVTVANLSWRGSQNNICWRDSVPWLTTILRTLRSFKI